MKTTNSYPSDSKISNLATAAFALLTLVTATMAAFSACSTARITSEQDKNVSFDTYHTFAWLPPDQKDLQTNITIRNQADAIQNAVDRELEIRGMLPDTSAPDLLLRYYIGTHDHTTYHNEPVYSYAMSRPFFWGRRMWYGGGGGYYQVYNRTYQTVVRDGTLTVDVIDRKTNNVIWRGISEERVDNLADMSAGISQNTRAIFEKYPLRPLVIAK
jgi:Domain of unknown function (DUF4136)